MIAARTPAAARRTMATGVLRSATPRRTSASHEAGGVADYNCDFTLQKRSHSRDEHARQNLSTHRDHTSNAITSRFGLAVLPVLSTRSSLAWP